MLFPTTIFAIFFLIVYAGHWLLPRGGKSWKTFLLLASYYFYGYWDWRFTGLLVLSSAVNHGLAVWLRGATGDRKRYAIHFGAVVFNLGLLGFFKYYNFFIDSVYAVCGRLGCPCSLPLLDVVLPIGISFFTFQAMSYVTDVYRRDIEPAPTLLDFALYLAFFPQLVAGPIVRASVLLPQLVRPAPVTRLDVGRATILILVGIFKKIVIASYLGNNLVDPVFMDPSAYGTLDVMLAIHGYTIQVYCDFSAYSDIAIGVALLMGIHFPINFNAPYFAVTLGEYWRRWHISLSSWLRDYIYFPLGGSRGSNVRTSVNLITVFLLCGLWHGAGWGFILWGTLHGIYLAAERLLRRRGLDSSAPAPATPKLTRTNWLPVAALWLLTFHFVSFSRIFFRAHTFDVARSMIDALGHWQPAQLYQGPILLALAVGFASQLFDGSRLRKLWDAFARLHPVIQALLAALVLTVTLALGPRGIAPFIYFQF